MDILKAGARALVATAPVPPAEVADTFEWVRQRQARLVLRAAFVEMGLSASDIGWLAETSSLGSTQRAKVHRWVAAVRQVEEGESGE